MPRTPIRQQNAPYGTLNNAGRRRKRPVPVIRQSGPAQPLEHFGSGVEPNTARALNTVQQNVQTALGAAKANPFANGNLLEGVSLTPGVNTIAHGLGTAYRGYVIHRQTAAALIYESAQTPASLRSSTIALNASSPVIIDLWVYA